MLISTRIKKYRKIFAFGAGTILVAVTALLVIFRNTACTTKLTSGLIGDRSKIFAKQETPQKEPPKVVNDEEKLLKEVGDALELCARPEPAADACEDTLENLFHMSESLLDSLFSRLKEPSPLYISSLILNKPYRIHPEVRSSMVDAFQALGYLMDHKLQRSDYEAIDRRLVDDAEGAQSLAEIFDASIHHFIKYVCLVKKIVALAAYGPVKYKNILAIASVFDCAHSPEDERTDSKVCLSNGSVLSALVRQIGSSEFKEKITKAWKNVSLSLIKIQLSKNDITRFKAQLARKAETIRFAFVHNKESSGKLGLTQFFGNVWSEIFDSVNELQICTNEEIEEITVDDAQMPSKLDCLSFCCRVSKGTIEMLVDKLKLNTNIRRLVLNGCCNDIGAVMDYVRSAKLPLTSLHLMNCGLTEVPDLGPLNKTLTALDLSKNSFPQGLTLSKISAIRNLKHLNLSECGISSLKGEKLTNTALETLILDKNDLAEFPSEFIESLPHLRELYCAYNKRPLTGVLSIRMLIKKGIEYAVLRGTPVCVEMDLSEKLRLNDEGVLTLDVRENASCNGGNLMKEIKKNESDCIKLVYTVITEDGVAVHRVFENE